MKKGKKSRRRKEEWKKERRKERRVEEGKKSGRRVKKERRKALDKDSKERVKWVNIERRRENGVKQRDGVHKCPLQDLRAKV